MPTPESYCLTTPLFGIPRSQRADTSLECARTRHEFFLLLAFPAVGELAGCGTALDVSKLETESAVQNTLTHRDSSTAPRLSDVELACNERASRRLGTPIRTPHWRSWLAQR